MRFTVAAAVAAGFLFGILALQLWHQDGVRADEKSGQQRFEYKVVFSPVEHVAIREVRTVGGQRQEIAHGPKESADAMTKQFNALAAEGWDYVGPVTSAGRPMAGDGTSGVLTVFRRAKQ
jgi:hypothetical protein